jgi:NTP pyrophosphatase (non-canonical NTP hydrolase)
MKKLTELRPLIIEWAKERNLIHVDNAPKQKLKLIEELGELSSAILKNDITEQKDAIGDCFVVLVILSEQLEKSYDLEMFYNHPENDVTENIYDLIDDIRYQMFNTAFDHLNDIAILLNLDLTECSNIAYNEIKDRKGKTINGNFIKNV